MKCENNCGREVGMMECYPTSIFPNKNLPQGKVWLCYDCLQKWKSKDKTQECVRTLLADDDMIDKVACEYELAKFQNRKRGDGMDERYNMKQALRNAAGMKEVGKK